MLGINKYKYSLGAAIYNCRRHSLVENLSHYMAYLLYATATLLRYAIVNSHTIEKRNNTVAVIVCVFEGRPEAKSV